MINIKRCYDKYNNMPISAKATIWFMVCSIIQKALIMLTTPFFTRVLSTTEYGQYVVYVSWLQIFTIITSLRLDYSIFNKGMTQFKSDKTGYTLTMQTITSIITISCFLVYLPFHKYIDSFIELPFILVILLFVECFFNASTSFWTVEQRYDFRFKRVIVVTLLLSSLNLLLGILFVTISEQKGYARILSCIVAQILIGIFLYVRNIIKGKKVFNVEYAKYALKFNIPLIPHYISMYLLDQSDKVMIQKICSTSEAGLYGVAASIGGTLKIVTTALNTTLIPVFYRKLEENNTIPIRKTILSVAYLLIGILLTLELIAPELMVLFAGEKYRVASYVIPPMAASVFLTFMYQLIANIEFFYNANKFTMVISVSGALLNIGLNFIFINMFGFIAAAYTTTLCYTIFLVAHFFYMRHIINKKGLPNIFSVKELLLLMGLLLIPTIGISFLYKYIIIRYLLFAVFLVVAFVKRKSIMTLVKGIRKK